MSFFATIKNPIHLELLLAMLLFIAGCLLALSTDAIIQMPFPNFRFHLKSSYFLMLVSLILYLRWIVYYLALKLYINIKWMWLDFIVCLFFVLLILFMFYLGYLSLTPESIAQREEILPLRPSTIDFYQKYTFMLLAFIMIYMLLPIVYVVFSFIYFIKKEFFVK